MSYYSPSIEKLIEAFEKLPSIGNKTAARLAFHILDASEEETNEFINSSVSSLLKSNMWKASLTAVLCPILGNLSKLSINFSIDGE